MTRPLDKRPIYIGAISASEFFATAIAPIIGGAIASALSWRWCFYFNVIVSIIPALITTLLFEDESGRAVHHVGHLQSLKQIDFVGMILFAAALLSLLFSIQWGGDTYSCSNDRIIALLAIISVFFIVFVLVQKIKIEILPCCHCDSLNNAQYCSGHFSVWPIRLSTVLPPTTSVFYFSSLPLISNYLTASNLVPGW
jgi:MFS family permease